MAAGHTTSFLRHIRTLAEAKEGCGLSDQQLLERFTDGRDEAAFATLIRRHGRMVLQLCCRILGNEHDAEDVFQATFLVLSHKSKSIKRYAAVGSWLYGVAHRLALKAKVKSVRRRAREARVSRSSCQESQSALSVREAHEVLDTELARLSDKHRAPLVLCYLEGLTRDEAAHRLGLAVGTFKSRLERARELLRLRLHGRGLTFSTALLASFLSEPTTSAAVSTELSAATVKAATIVVAGQSNASLMSPGVAALVKGALHTMLLKKLGLAAAVVSTVCVLCAAAGFLTFTALGQDKNPPTDHINRGKGAAKPLILELDGVLFRMASSPGERIIGGISHTQDRKETKDKQRTVHHSTVKFWDAVSGELKLSLGEEKEVRIAAISISAGAKLAAIAVQWDDGMQRVDRQEIRLLDLATGTVTKTIGQAAVSAMAFSPDGRTVALGGADLPRDLNGPFHRVVRLWDVETGKVTKEFKQQLDEPERQREDGYLEGLRDLAFSRDGKLLATADADFMVRMVNVQTGEVQHKLSAHTSPVTKVAFAPNGKILVSGSLDESVRIWDVPTGKELQILPGTKGRVNALAFSPNGKLLATGTTEVTLWDTSSWQSKTTVPGTQGAIADIAFVSENGKTLAVGAGRQIRLWEVQALLAADNDTEPSKNATFVINDELKKLQGTWKTVAMQVKGQDEAVIPAEMQKVVIHGDVMTTSEPYKLTINAGKDPKELDLDPLEAPPAGRGRSRGIYELRGDELTIVIALPDVERPREFKTTENLAQVMLKLKREEVRQVLLEAPKGDPKPAQQWEKPPPAAKDMTLPENRAGEVWALSIARDGRSFALARGFSDASADVQLWDLTEGTKKALVRSDKAVHAVAFSPDGRHLASGGFDNVLRIFDVDSGRMLHELHGHHGGITSLAWSKDGKRLVTGSLDAAVRLWDPIEGQDLETLWENSQWVFGVAFMPDKNEVASSCMDGSVFIWDVATQKERLKFKGSSGAQTVVISPDGTKIAAGFWDRTVQLWDSTTGESLGVLRGHSMGIYGLSFSPDGQYLASTSGHYGKSDLPGEIKIWDVKTAKAIRTMRGHKGAIWSCIFSHDGRTLFTGGADQTVRSWDHHTGAQLAQFDVPIGLAVAQVPASGQDARHAVDSGYGFWWLVAAGLTILAIGGLAVARLLRHRSNLEPSQAPPAGVSNSTDVSCVRCQKRLRIPTHAVGKKIKCPGCATAFVT